MATPTISNEKHGSSTAAATISLTPLNLATAGRIYVVCASTLNHNLPGPPVVTYSYSGDGGGARTFTLLDGFVECPAAEQTVATTLVGGSLRVFYWDSPPTSTDITVTVTPRNQSGDLSENNPSFNTAIAFAVHGTNASGPADWLIKFENYMWGLSPNGSTAATNTSWSNSINAVSSTDLVVSALMTMTSPGTHVATTGAIINAGAGTVNFASTISVSSLAASGAGSQAMSWTSVASHFGAHFTMLFRDSGASAADLIRLDTPRGHYNWQEANIGLSGVFTEATGGNFDDLQYKTTNALTGATITDWTEVAHSKPGGGVWTANIPNPGHFGQGFKVQVRFRNSSDIVQATSSIAWRVIRVGFTALTDGSSTIDYIFSQGSGSTSRQMRRRNAIRYAPYINEFCEMRGPHAIAFCNAFLDAAAEDGITDTCILMIDCGDDGSDTTFWDNIADTAWVNVLDAINECGGEVDFFYSHIGTNNIRNSSAVTGAAYDTKAELSTALVSVWDVITANWPGVKNYWVDAQSARNETYVAGAPRDRYVWSVFREISREYADSRSELVLAQVPVDLDISGDSIHVNPLPDGRWSGLRAGRAVGGDFFGLSINLLGPDFVGWTPVDSTHAIAHFEPDPLSDATGLTTRKRGTTGVTGFLVTTDEPMATVISPDNYTATIIAPWDVLLTFTGGQTIAVTDYIRYMQGSGSQTVGGVAVNLPDRTNCLYDDSDIGSRVKVIATGQTTEPPTETSIGMHLSELTLTDGGDPIQQDDILIAWLQVGKDGAGLTNPAGMSQIYTNRGAQTTGTRGFRLCGARLTAAQIAAPSTDFVYSGWTLTGLSKDTAMGMAVLRLPTDWSFKTAVLENAPADGDLDGTAFTRDPKAVGIYALVVATADTTTISPPSADWETITSPVTLAGDWTVAEFLLRPAERYTSGAAYAFTGISTSAGAAVLLVIELLV